MNTAVHFDVPLVLGALERLGVTAAELETAVRRGDEARSWVTEYHPPNAAGLYAWAETVGSLRGQKAEQNWTLSNEKNVPVIVSPDGKVAIGVMSGDEGTGRRDRTPRSRYAKGEALAHACQLNLFALLGETFDGEQVPDRQTWYLLIYRTADQIRYELSQPTGIGEYGRVSEWVERIIFDPIYPERELPPTALDTAEPIDVPVTRITG